MVRIVPGWNKARVLERKRLPCVVTEQPDSNWSTALAALRELLAQPDPPKAPATVILSNHFVRYLVLPWSAELVTQAEELDFARARFAQVFGDKAHQWSIRTSDAPARMERLAVAADTALIESLAHTLKTSGLTLESCQPALMAQFNGSRDRIGDNAWMVTAEPGRLLLAWIHKGRWRSVRARPLNGSAVLLRDVLQQERLLVSAGDADEKVFISAADEAVIDTQGMRPEQLGPRNAGPLETPADAIYTLAMAGMP
jgi:hypothetical protein